MRLSKLFFQTLRDAPAASEFASDRLLARAGYVRQLAAGLYDLLPLGRRALQRLERVLREEMAALGAQEVSLPVLQPAELWRHSGRWETVGPDLFRLSDRQGREFCLGMTHEEAATHLAAQVIQSYRQLPAVLYQLQTKLRDEPRPRAGLIRAREFLMKDAYSFHRDEADLEHTYQAFYQAYGRIFERVGLEVLAVESEVGMMGGSSAHEFMLLSESGEDTLLLCPHGDYRANRQVARFAKPQAISEEALPLQEVATPETTTIASLAALLGVPAAKTAKAVFLTRTDNAGTETLVFAVLRGDLELNEAKLSAVLGGSALRAATPEEIRAIGAEPGYASPIGIRRAGVSVVVDDAIALSPNLAAGANRKGWHLKNTNCGRDYQADAIADIAAARSGDACPACGAALQAERGIELGNIFKLGTWYSEALDATFLDEAGRSRPLVMGSYGIGVGRLLAAIAEAHHDGAGICWPAEVAPYQLHLLALPDRHEPGVLELAERLYAQLRAAGRSILYDDRNESPGVKFADADLIGLPLRLTVGRRSVGVLSVELKVRASGARQNVPIERLGEALAAWLG